MKATNASVLHSTPRLHAIFPYDSLAGLPSYSRPLPVYPVVSRDVCDLKLLLSARSIVDESYEVPMGSLSRLFCRPLGSLFHCPLLLHVGGQEHFGASRPPLIGVT